MTKQLSFVIEKTKELLHNNLLKLAMERSSSSRGGGVTDITTGKAYDALRRKAGMGNSDLSLTFNTDGSPLFVSSKTSVWPIQFTVNQLPPSIRFKHTTLAGLWFGKSHPNMTAFLAKFVDQVKSMKPVMWEHSSEMHRSRAYVLCCCVDAPARAAVQNMVLFNGSFGCSWCLISGEHLEGRMRYVTKEPPAPRTSELVVRDMQLSLRLGITINGIKGPSLLMNLPGFDLVGGVSVEYMQAVLQGAAKQFAELLLSSSNSQKRFYIGAPSCVARVDSRLLQIKPPHCVTRLPRSLNERSFWTASEWRLWLLFCALPCLVEILPLEYWKHLSKLSQAILILLRETITADEIKRAGALRGMIKLALLAVVRSKPLTQLGNPKAILTLAPGPLTFHPACACEIFPDNGDHGEFVHNSWSLEMVASAAIQLYITALKWPWGEPSTIAVISTRIGRATC
ncbi:hypothetical protein HPB47_015475 [Ixodes persulcatus]|uniref:Uncharacterized protein n=1 Tax=Ixodes persulcatus TaxID=34615 RepID=A0AC60QTD8_IXOPE|nr:hypothetical protein HPB47_015475 [Ixodes persulcatus]